MRALAALAGIVAVAGCGVPVETRLLSNLASTRW